MTKSKLALLGSILNRPAIFCDIGSRGGLEMPWKAFRRHVDTISFEADIEEARNLTKNKTSGDLIFPYALSSRIEEKVLNLTTSRGCSSIYEPNWALIDQFPEKERFKIEKRFRVVTNTLDCLFSDGKICDVDFLKLDTQGAELDILEGGINLIQTKGLGIQVEVSFRPVYREQPLFQQIDKFISSHFDMVMVDLRKSFWKYCEGKSVGSKKGQLIQGDALYFRNPETFFSWLETIPEEERQDKLVSAIVVSTLYGKIDFHLRLISDANKLSIYNGEQLKQLSDAIKYYGRYFEYRFIGSGLLRRIGQTLHYACENDHAGWAYGEETVGSQKKWGVFN